MINYAYAKWIISEEPHVTFNLHEGESGLH